MSTAMERIASAEANALRLLDESGLPKDAVALNIAPTPGFEGDRTAMGERYDVELRAITADQVRAVLKALKETTGGGK